ncbi:type II secretion system F family protein [Acetobacter orientalis]|uniref:type II secretion system F family protein n=1 Tax=Acetobacter orientalis TaxID=146474 RepID=UPI0039EC1DCA
MSTYLLLLISLLFLCFIFLAYVSYQIVLQKEIRSQRIHEELTPFFLQNSSQKKKTILEILIFLFESGIIKKFLMWASKYNPDYYAHTKVGLLKIYLYSSILPCITLFFLMKTIGLWSVFINFFIWLFVICFFCTFLHKKYKEKLYEQFPDAIGMMVRSLRVGIPLSRCMIIVSEECDAPTCNEFKLIANEVAVGRSLADILQKIALRVDLPEYRFLATVISIQSETGGALADVLASLAETIRKQISIYKRGIALSSEAQTSAYVLAAIPFFIFSLLEFINPAYINQLFYNQIGHYFLIASVVFLVSGILTMKLIIKKVLDI